MKKEKNRTSKTVNDIKTKFNTRGGIGNLKIRKSVMREVKQYTIITHTSFPEFLLKKTKNRSMGKKDDEALTYSRGYVAF